nr:type II toxin-antitoxin system RelE/ParE family toxin [Sagittula salina]
MTPHAEESLYRIALWTLDRFGPAQAERYQADLLERCEAVAAGRAVSYDCAVLAGDDTDGLRFVRAGEHFAVFVDLAAEVVFVDFLHGHSNLPRHVASLTRKRQV